MVLVYLHGRVANDKVSADDVSLNSRGQKDPIRIPDSRVLLDHVTGVVGINKTDTKVVSLGRISISTEPVPTEPVAAGAAGQSYTAAWTAAISISDRNVVVEFVIRATACDDDARSAIRR